MTTRRLLLLAIAGGAGTTAITEAERKKKPEPKGIAIAMRFVFEGKHYGLAVPIFDPTFKDSRRPHGLGVLEVIDGQQTVTLNDSEMNVLIMMLEDLRTSKAETLRMLQGEGRLATRKA